LLQFISEGSPAVVVGGALSTSLLLGVLRSEFQIVYCLFIVTNSLVAGVKVSCTEMVKQAWL